MPVWFSRLDRQFEIELQFDSLGKYLGKHPWKGRLPNFAPPIYEEWILKTFTTILLVVIK